MKRIQISHNIVDEYLLKEALEIGLNIIDKK